MDGTTRKPELIAELKTFDLPRGTASVLAVEDMKNLLVTRAEIINGRDYYNELSSLKANKQPLDEMYKKDIAEYESTLRWNEELRRYINETRMKNPIYAKACGIVTKWFDTVSKGDEESNRSYLYANALAGWLEEVKRTKKK